MKQLEFIKQHREEIIAIAHKNGARGLRVFGSVARGEDTETSDIDLMVTQLDTGRDLFDFLSLKEDLESYFDKRVDLVFQDGLNWFIRDQILDDAVDI